MAIYAVEGKLGSGKTYFCVYYLLKKYFKWDELIEEWIPNKKIILVSNIDDLKIEHIDLADEVKNKGVEKVFHNDFIKGLRDSYKLRQVVFIIDEAWKYFPKKFYSDSVIGFFTESRHQGLDVFLITADIWAICPLIKNLAEEYIHACSRTYGTGKGFHYKYMSGDEVSKSKHLPRDRTVFDAYKSYYFDEGEKPKPVYLRYIGYFAVLVFISIVAFKFLFMKAFIGHKILGTDVVKKEKSVEKKVVNENIYDKSKGVVANKMGNKLVFRGMQEHDTKVTQKVKKVDKLEALMLSGKLGNIDQKHDDRVSRVNTVAGGGDIMAPECQLYFSVIGESGELIEKLKCPNGVIRRVDGIVESGYVHKDRSGASRLGLDINLNKPEGGALGSSPANKQRHPLGEG